MKLQKIKTFFFIFSLGISLLTKSQPVETNKDTTTHHHKHTHSNPREKGYVEFAKNEEVYKKQIGPSNDLILARAGVNAFPIEYLKAQNNNLASQNEIPANKKDSVFLNTNGFSYKISAKPIMIEIDSQIKSLNKNSTLKEIAKYLTPRFDFIRDVYVIQKSVSLIGDSLTLLTYQNYNGHYINQLGLCSLKDVSEIKFRGGTDNIYVIELICDKAFNYVPDPSGIIKLKATSLSFLAKDSKSAIHVFKLLYHLL